MLPIFKKLSEKSGNSGVLIKERAPDEHKESEDQNDSDAAKEACGRDLLNAIKSGDALAVGQALYDAAQAADLEPHEEGSHPEPHSYDAQNQKAGQD